MNITTLWGHLFEIAHFGTLSWMLAILFLLFFPRWLYRFGLLDKNITAFTLRPGPFLAVGITLSLIRYALLTASGGLTPILTRASINTTLQWMEFWAAVCLWIALVRSIKRGITIVRNGSVSKRE